MKHSILYTVLSVLNLITFAIVVACLPKEVAVFYNAGIVERLGSPWVFLAFPAVTAFLALGVFVVELRAKPKRRLAFLLSLFAAGIALSALGWAYLALAAQGAGFGEHVYMMPWFVVTLVLTSLGMLLGYLFGASKTTRLAAFGVPLFAASLAGFAAAVGIAFGVPAFDWAALLVYIVLLAAALPIAWFRKN